MAQKEQMQDALRLLLEERTVAYDLLRIVFQAEPSREFVQTLAEDPLTSIFSFADGEQSILTGCNQVSNYFADINVIDEQEYQRLHWDYTKMFIGPHELIAPPWESAYTSKERLLFQEITLQVRKAYLKHHFIPKQYLHEADDHIGLELDFMYLLAKQTLEALQKDDLETTLSLLGEQRGFLQQHLRIWIPRFADKIIDGADTDFYRGMANVLKGMVVVDENILEEMIAVLK